MPANTAKPSQWFSLKAMKQPSRVRPRIIRQCHTACAAAAACQAVWHWTMIRHRTREGCFKAFRLNHWVGFAVFAGVVAAYVVG